MLGQVIVLGGSIYYLAKEKTAAGWLMTIGTALGFLTYIFQVYVFPRFIEKKDLDSISISDYYYVFYAVNILFSLLFAIGFIMLILKAIKKKEVSEAEKYL